MRGRHQIQHVVAHDQRLNLRRRATVFFDVVKDPFDFPLQNRSAGLSG